MAAARQLVTAVAGHLSRHTLALDSEATPLRQSPRLPSTPQVLDQHQAAPVPQLSAFLFGLPRQVVPCHHRRPERRRQMSRAGSTEDKPLSEVTVDEAILKITQDK